ncbi:MAG TPA: response regulator [Ancylobacter sp.]
MHKPDGRHGHIPEDRHGAELVLMAEDSPTQAEHLRWLLEEAGYRVAAAPDGRQALDLAREVMPDLIVSDVVMPGMDGYELCKAIKSDPALKHIPVVLVTSLAHPRDVIAGLNCGADNFITKPYDGRHLIARLRYLTANNRLRTAGKMQLGVQIELQGERHFITADRQQVLDLLISTYDEAVHLNDDLHARQNELEASLKSLDGLTQITEALNRSTTMDAVLREGLTRTIELLDADAGWLTLDDYADGVMPAVWEGLYPADIPLASQPRPSEEPGAEAGVHVRDAVPADDSRNIVARSHLHIPIVLDGRPLGSLNIRPSSLEEIEPRTAAILTAIGQQVGVAVERARLLAGLEETVEQRTAELKQEVDERRRAQESAQARGAHLAEVVRLGHLALVETCPSVLLRDAVESVCHVLGLPFGGIWLHRHDTDALVLAADNGWAGKASNLAISQASQSHHGRALIAGERTLVRDWRSEQGFALPSFMATLGIRSSLSVPVRGTDRISGVLAFDSDVVRPFSDDDAAFVVSVANVVGAALGRAEGLAALHRSEDEFRATFEQAPIGVTHMEPNGKWRRTNQHISTVLGYSREELLDIGFAELIHPEHRDLAMETIRRLLEGEIDHSVEELRYIHKSGRDIWAKVTNTVKRTADGVPEYVIGILEDITEQREAQAKISHLQRMEAIGRLTSGIAHDFNNLLTLVIGNLEPLQLRVAAGSPEAHFVAGALQGANRGAELTRRLLSLARRQVLHTQIVDINDLVRDIVGLMQRSFGAGIEVVFHKTDQPCRCAVDPIELETALMNLSVNAMDAMPNGGRFVVNTGIQNFSEDDVEHIEGLQSGQYAEITVSDTGTGIPPHIRERIFEPYFTTKDRGKGTGLGLSLVYGFVKQSGGHIAIYSEVGRGTTIRLYLPLETSQGSLTEAVAAQLAMPDECLLIVDDQDEVRELLTRQMRSLGYAVLEAANAQEALAMLRAGLRVDLMITDVAMPGSIDGVMLARTMLDTYTGIGVIISSGFDAYVLPAWIEAEHRCAVVSKPLAVSDMATAIRRLLDLERANA